MAEDEFAVEASHIMMFARAIGDANPIYYDAEYARGTEPGGIIAPPTFPQASAQFQSSYALRPQIGKPWFGSGATPSGTRMPPEKGSGSATKPEAADGSAEKKPGSGAAAGGLHAEQHFTYHRALRPGDVLTLTRRPGKTWEKQGKRAGKLIFSENITEYRDQEGDLVVTARGVSVRTERVIERS